MSTALLRRDSSKQGLQKLLRVTAQRSLEDAEEVEREQRRRRRESHRRPEDPQNEEEPKPGRTSSLEEDEGFSDGGAQQRERARRRQAGLDSGEEETAWDSSQPRLRRQERQEEEKEEATDGRTEPGRAAGRERVEREKGGTRGVRQVVCPAPNREIEHKKETKLNQSKACLQQEVFHSKTNGNTSPQEVTSCMNMKTIRPISHQEKENQEQEQLKQRQQEAEQELEVMKRRREERRRVREEELRREEGEELRLAGEEEQRRRLKGQPERRTPAADRGQSSSQEEGVSPVCPRATPKISERTESLSRSLKKSNSFKKTQPPVLLSRLDDRLEQYANAIETSQQEVRAVRRCSGDLPSPTGPLASRRSVFQAGETPSPSRPAGCKASYATCYGLHQACYRLHPTRLHAMGYMLHPTCYRLHTARLHPTCYS
ncbi:non-muscle caldesmon-like isoform X2 [Gadus chalcogrammus]|uniref:non-muscle caldesmon-like isoform X2 n=1 Tax=Gadus chalcogrammus TaxID=1042646 RepID=UPI0024C4C3A0|nr:non-muscle caldesmon-like isoform X2 [Gadus chalcogrammus]